MVVNPSTGRRRARVEALVDQLMALLIPDTGDAIRGPIIRAIRQARSVRQAGDPRKAMVILAELQLAGARGDLRYWVHSEWLNAAHSAGFAEDSWLYTAGTAQAAVLVPDSQPNRLRVVTVIGLRWEPGKIVSRMSLRSLALLHVTDRPNGGSP